MKYLNKWMQLRHKGSLDSIEIVNLVCKEFASA